MGSSLILSIIYTVTIGAIPNSNGGNNGHGLKRYFVNRPLNTSNSTRFPFNHPPPNYHYDHDGTIMLIFTTHKRSLGQGNVFTPVCHCVHRCGGKVGSLV